MGYRLRMLDLDGDADNTNDPFEASVEFSVISFRLRQMPADLFANFLAAERVANAGTDTNVQKNLATIRALSRLRDELVAIDARYPLQGDA